MANNDLVKKKPVALEVATYKRLSDLAAQLRMDNPDGGFVSMSAAVERLLNLWDKKTNEPKGMTLLELLEATKKLEGLDDVEIAVLDASIEGWKAANAEANKQVIIKQSDGSQYLEKNVGA